MHRKLLACLLTIVMVLGLCGLAAAAPKKNVGPDWKQVQGTGDLDINVEDGEEEGEEEEEEGPELGRQHSFKEKLIGPPAFVKEKHELKIKLRGMPFVTELPPVLKGGRMLIPLRAISNGLKATVDWDADERKITITKGDVEVIIYLGEMTYYVNGEEMQFDVGPDLINNRTFVPLRFIAEALGAKVDYDDETGEVIIDCDDDCNCEECVDECEANCDCPECEHECDEHCDEECEHECDDDDEESLD
ncbi:MAG: copper amine oxidase N-terminal domain-containing protein [Bacillota bacterium]|nr:copper amine oxidase N-terminal domain-containing protein [Bacillota bacterium]